MICAQIGLYSQFSDSLSRYYVLNLTVRGPRFLLFDANLVKMLVKPDILAAEENSWYEEISVTL